MILDRFHLDGQGGHRHRRRPRHRRRHAPWPWPRPGPTWSSPPGPPTSWPRWPRRSRRRAAGPWSVPADLSDLEAVAAPGRPGPRRLRPPRPGGEQRGRAPCPGPSWTRRRVGWSRPSTSTCPPPTPSSGRPCPSCWRGRAASVVNISSAMGRMAGRGYLAYGTAKGALAHYTRLAAADLAPRIRVNAIAVGSVATSALDIVMQTEELRDGPRGGTPLEADRPARGDRRRRALPGLGGRCLHHRQDPRGRRGHRVAQPGHGPTRRVTRGQRPTH